MLGVLLVPFAAGAQAGGCAEVQERLNAGDPTLTSQELLDCGLSPEARDPCEGNPDPNCDAGQEGAYPSINTPSGEQCSLETGWRSDLGRCAPAATATATPGPVEPLTAAPTATASATATTDATRGTAALPETGGLGALSLAALGLLLSGGLLSARLVRR